jgi:hypothetical protein
VKLSYTRLRQIENALRRRHKRTKDPNFVGIGFGTAIRDGQADPERGFVVHYYVKKKRDNVKTKHRILPKVTLYVMRGKKRIRVALPTDVVEVGDLRTTGWAVNIANRELVTTGIVIRWQLIAGGDFQYGIITVAHGFSGASGLIWVQPPGAAPKFSGALYVSGDPDVIDAAVVEVELSDLQASLVLTTFPTPRSVDELISDASTQASGDSLRFGTAFGPDPVSLNVYSFSAFGIDLPGLPRLQDSLLAKSSINQAFHLGSSGSVWQVNSKPAGMQFAGQDPNYVTGVAQAVETLLTWARVTMKVAYLQMLSAF